MAHAPVVRALVGRIHAAGGAVFSGSPPDSGVYAWKTRLGRWPLEVQVDRYAGMIRCYIGDELFCTGRIPEDEVGALIAPAAGRGDEAAGRELAAYVDDAVRSDSRRFLAPPHPDRHPDRRADPRQDATIRALPPRDIDRPA